MPRVCKACNCGSVSESEPDPLCNKSRVSAAYGALGSAGIHQPLSWSIPVSVASNEISSYFMPAVAGVAVMVRDGLNTNCHWPCQKSKQKVMYTQLAARPRVAPTH